MTQPAPDKWTPGRADLWISALAGLAIPLMVVGRSGLQGALALALVGALLVDRGRLWQALRPQLMTPLARLLGLMLLVWVPGMWVSPGPWHSVSTWARTPLLMVGAVLLWAFLAADRRRQIASRRAVVLGGLAALALALTSLYAYADLALMMRGSFGPSQDVRPGLVFKSFASATVCLIPLALWSGFRLGGHWRGAGIAVAALSLVLIIATNSRSALFGAGVMAVVLIAALSLTRRQWLPVGGLFIAAVIGGTLVYLLDSQGWRADNPADFLPPWLIDSHRQQIWRYVIEQARLAPWFGHGINAVNFLPGAGERAAGIAAEVLPSHPHNWVLELLVETGALGLGCLVVVLAYVFFGELGRFLRTGSLDSLALVVIMAGFWGSSLFNFSIWSSWWLMSLFVSFAMVRAHSNHLVVAG